ncbi:lasso peptide biosynthesis PqqD family chaperone [Streptomyces sp. NPDC058257]|uniref:lasso peptide biosynthesis PqqD family chaperone n=1 Tax=Streptomyces sp. NPDC058257 TaxID=3346409 RepID=UPI0036E4CE26
MRLTLDPDVAVAETDDGAVLLHQLTGRYWQLNRTGADVLRLLLDGCGSEEVAGRLALRHAIDPGDAHRDVVRVTDELTAAQLLRTTS